MPPTPEDHLYARYALAIALVPDPDQAQELFWRSRSEPDLRRRCADWRAQHGLPPHEVDPPLPALDAEQRTHALALARLGRKRRLVLPLAGGGALVLVAVLLLLLALLDWRARSQLVAAPAYREAALRTLDRDGLHLAIYRAETNETTGQTVVWWELTGPQAGGEERMQAQIKGVGPQQRFVQPDRVMVAHPARHRVLMRTDYPFVMPLGDHLVVQVQRIGDHVLDWETNMPVVLTGQSAQTHVVTLNRDLQNYWAHLNLHSITITPSHTVVEYMTPGMGPPKQYSRLLVDGKPVEWEGILPGPADNQQRYREVFAALPKGSQRLHWSFAPWGVDMTGPDLHSTSFFALGESRQLQQLPIASVQSEGEGSHLDVTLRAPSESAVFWQHVVPETTRLTTPSGGFITQATVTIQSNDANGLFLHLRSDACPPDWRTATLEVEASVSAADTLLQADVDLQP